MYASSQSAYVLQHAVQETAAALQQGNFTAEDGVDGSFELLYEISDKVTSGKWVGDCFIFTNGKGRLNYSVAGQIQTLVHLDTNAGGATQHRVLGYLAKEDRVYLIDKAMNVTSHKVMLAMLQYQTAVVRGDFDAANELLPEIPESEHLVVARFLDAQGFKEEALAVSPDADHKFELACDLGLLETGLELMEEVVLTDEADSIDTQSKWKRLSDLALKQSKFDLCLKCADSCNDYSGLLLLHTAMADAEGIKRLAVDSGKAGKSNVSFLCYFLLGEVDACVDLLIKASRLPEAAFFSRTYMPSRVDEVMALWKADLGKTSESVADSLACPKDNLEMFPEYEVALKVEKMFFEQRKNGGGMVAAAMYLEAKGDLGLDLIDMMKSGKMGAPAAAPAAAPVEEISSGADETAEQAAIEQAAMEKAAADKAAAEKAAAELEAAAAAAEAERKAAEEAAAAVAASEAAAAAEAAAAVEAAAAAEEAETDALADEFADDW